MPDDFVPPFHVPDGKNFVLIGPSCFGPMPTFLRALSELVRTLEQYRVDQCDAGVAAWYRRTPTEPWQLMSAAP